MMISGTNNLLKWQHKSQSYHFSHDGSIWGWATWRRAWNFYDYEMEKWTHSENQEKIREIFRDEQEYILRKGIKNTMKVGTHAKDKRQEAFLKYSNYDFVKYSYFHKIFELTFQKKIDTWDYQWKFACLLQKGLTIVPAINLIKNMGFNTTGTHTTQFYPYSSDLDPHGLDFPLSAPSTIEADYEYDHQYFLIRIGKPHLNTLLFFIEEFLAINKNIQAFILVETALKIYPDLDNLINLKTIILSKLRDRKNL